MESYYNMCPSDRRNGRNMNTNCRQPMKPDGSNCKDRDYPVKSDCKPCNNTGSSCRSMRPEPRQKTYDCKKPYSSMNTMGKQCMHDKMPYEDCKCKDTYESHCHKHDAMEQLGCKFPTVMAYVPWQQWGDLYDPDCALKEGTLFKELNLIFCGVRY